MVSAKRVGIWGLVLAALGTVIWYRGTVFPEPKESSTIRVLFITGGSDPFWQLTVKGAYAAASDHNADLKVEMPSQDEGLAQQMQILVRVDSSQVDGVAISPLSAEGQTRLLNLLAKKVNVVTFDSDAPLSERQYYVGTSNFAAGRICSELVRESMPDGGKAAVLISNLTKNNTIERKAGFEETINLSSEKQSEAENRASIEIVEYFLDEGDNERCQENVRLILEQHPDLTCLVGMNGYHGPILLEKLRDAKKLGQIKLIVFDEAEETLDGIAAEHIYATVAQDPYKYGYEAVRMLTELSRGDKQELPIVGGGAMNVPCEAIRKADLASFQQRLAERLGEDGNVSEAN